MSDADIAAEENYQAALTRWASRCLTDDGVVFESIEDVDTNVSTTFGCPTCGDYDTDLEVTISYVSDGERKRLVVTYGQYAFSTFMSELVAAATEETP